MPKAASYLPARSSRAAFYGLGFFAFLIIWIPGASALSIALGAASSTLKALFLLPFLVPAALLVKRSPIGYLSVTLLALVPYALVLVAFYLMSD
jgi:uncharacterized membrane protein